MPSLEEAIRKHALKNALDYGKTSPNAIIGKIINEFPDAKKDVKGAMAIAGKICSEINSMGKDAIQSAMSDYTYAEKKEEKKSLELPNALQGKVITRFPPEPSGYLHIGHAKAAYLDYESAKRYGGKFLLRFDDTNPEKEKQEFVDAIISDLKWLGITPDEILFASDYMQKIYEYAQKMLSGRHAYVCTCPQEKAKEDRFAKRECECRQRSEKDNLQLFNEMLAGNVPEGTAAVRFSGNMSSENTAMRDPTLLRIIKSPHYRQGKKYCAWPSYDFEGAVMDSITGITHAMRTKEYELRDELYFAILDALHLRKPELVEFSRLQITGMPISKRLITPLIEQGKVSGYDDFRLPTLRGLARRGILPDAIKTFVLSFGLSKVESSPTLDALVAENKKIIDKASRRLFFVKNPTKITVQNPPQSSAALLKNHPTEKMGERKISAGTEFFISGTDAEHLQPGSIFRLKGLYNLKAVSKEGEGILAEYAGTDLVDCPKMQWVTSGFLSCIIKIPGLLFTPDEKFNEGNLVIDEGYCEEECKNLAPGSVIQFERYGFVKLDKKEEGKLEFIFIST